MPIDSTFKHDWPVWALTRSSAARMHMVKAIYVPLSTVQAGSLSTCVRSKQC